MSNVSQRQMPLLQRPARFAQPVRLRALRRPVVVRLSSKFVAGRPRFAGLRTSGVDRPNQCPRLARTEALPSKKLNESQAMQVMSQYYFANKSILPKDTPQHRGRLIELLMSGLSAEEAFAKVEKSAA